MNIFFNSCFLFPFLIALPEITSPAAVVRTLFYFRLLCSAIGSPPVFVALIRNCYTLINTTNVATITLYEEGNYTCVATNKYGTDAKNVLVIFNGKIAKTEKSGK